MVSEEETWTKSKKTDKTSMRLRYVWAKLRIALQIVAVARPTMVEHDVTRLVGKWTPVHVNVGESLDWFWSIVRFGSFA